MRNELFLNKNPSDKAQTIAKIYKILDEMSPAENGYVVTIKKNLPLRSISQNKFYWAVVSLYANNCGYHREEIDSMFRMARWYEWREYPSGKAEKIPKRSSDKDTGEFTTMCNLFLDWAKEEFPEVTVPRKEDLTYIQWMNIENEYDRNHSG